MSNAIRAIAQDVNMSWATTLAMLPNRNFPALPKTLNQVAGLESAL
jgi:hypothetical protein